jgi:hypothetical protein
MYIGLHVKYPLFLSDFSVTWIFLTDFQTILQYKISWRSVQWGPNCFKWTDRHEANIHFLHCCACTQQSMQHNDHSFMSQRVRPSSRRLSYRWCTYMVLSYLSPAIVFWEVSWKIYHKLAYQVTGDNMLAYFLSQYVCGSQLFDILHTIVSFTKQHPPLNFSVKHWH